MIALNLLQLFSRLTAPASALVREFAWELARPSVWRRGLERAMQTDSLALALQLTSATQIQASASTQASESGSRNHRSRRQRLIP